MFLKSHRKLLSFNILAMLTRHPGNTIISDRAKESMSRWLTVQLVAGSRNKEVTLRSRHGARSQGFLFAP